jgi:predicted transcriptional regulator
LVANSAFISRNPNPTAQGGYIWVYSLYYQNQLSAKTQKIEIILGSAKF